MNFDTPKEFVVKLDRTFLKFVSVPILFFFVYYCYFSYHQGRGTLLTPELDVKWIYIYIGLWTVPVYMFWKKKKSMIKTAFDKESMIDKLDIIYEHSLKSYWFIFILIIISICVFCLTNHSLVSLPVWVMIIIISVEKPSIYRVGKLLRFRTKDQYMTFVNDQWP